MPHPKGGYRLSNGKKCVGTTTPIGRFKDSGALLWWAFEQGKAAERGEIGSLYDKRDSAAEAGTLAHEFVEKYINEGIEPAPPTEHPTEIFEQAYRGFENYRRWADDNRMIIVDQEMILVSEKYKYGGCPDAVAYDSQQRLCLLDWKTSNGTYPDYLIQLAAYGNLWDENNPDNPITGGYHLCRFSKEYADFHHHYWSELDDAWKQFTLFLRCYEIDKKLKKRV